MNSHVTEEETEGQRDNMIIPERPQFRSLTNLLGPDLKEVLNLTLRAVLTALISSFAPTHFTSERVSHMPAVSSQQVRGHPAHNS